MKTKIIGLLIAMLLIINIMPVVLTNEDEYIIKEENHSIVFSNLKTIQEGRFVKLDLEETNSFLMDPGKPMLPLYSKVFKFPFGTQILDVTCKPLDINKISIDKIVEPSPIPHLLSDNDKFSNIDDYFELDESVYENKDYFPKSWYEYTIGGGFDGSSQVVYLVIKFFPIKYSPLTNIIEFASEANIKVNVKEPVSQPIKSDEYDMIIISPSEFVKDLEPLEYYKNDTGVKSIIITLNDINTGVYFPTQGRDQQEKIKYFIKNAIEEWDTTNVLLAGGENKIPVRMSHVWDGMEESIISDLYYADIYDGYGDFCSWDSNDNDIFGEFYDSEVDDVDLYPNIRLGRLNFRDEDQVSIVVDKIITYQSTGAYMEDWFSTMIVCGGDTFEDGMGVDEGELLNQHALDMMDDFTPDKLWVTNGRLQLALNVDNAIKNGAGFLYMTGHGTPDCWFTYPHNNFNVYWPIGTYLNLHVINLKNQEKLPVVVIGGCSNLEFLEEVCFGWSFLKSPEGGGIAVYGNSALGWGYVGSGCTNGLTGGMELSAFKAYAIQNSETTGELWTTALTNYLNEFGVWSAHGYKTVEEWQAFNDPSLRISQISNKPKQPEKPDGPETGDANTEYSYTTSTTEPDGDMIKYCFDWGDDTVTWTDWMEPGEITLSHIWERPGNYEVRVKARDVYGLDSEWSESLMLHIVGPILDIASIRGGLFKVVTALENIGDGDTTDIDWSIQVIGGMTGFLNITRKGTIETLSVGEKTKIKCVPIIGFGQISIKIQASSPSSNIIRTTLKGIVIGFMVIA